MSAPYKADVVAAERLLKAAVRRAVDTLRTDLRPVERKVGPASFLWRHRTAYELDATRAAVATMLAEAGRSAELLLGVRDA